MLNEPDPNRWEVANAGAPGTDTWQHEILLRRLLKATRAHAVVLALYVNDVAPQRDPRSLNASGQTNTWNKRVTYLLKRSAVFTVIYKRLLPAWYGWWYGLSNEDAVLGGSHKEGVELGWRQVDESLGVMSELCRARGVPFLVAILPRRDQVSGNRSWRAYKNVMRSSSLGTRTTPRLRITQSRRASLRPLRVSSRQYGDDHWRASFYSDRLGASILGGSAWEPTIWRPFSGWVELDAACGTRPMIAAVPRLLALPFLDRTLYGVAMAECAKLATMLSFVPVTTEVTAHARWAHSSDRRRSESRHRVWNTRPVSL